MTGLLDQLPIGFQKVPYNGAAIPDGRHDLSAGANCQRYAYAVLAHFGQSLPPWWSSELWEDTTWTFVVTTLEPLDLLLFNRTDDPFGAHLGVYSGQGAVLHLAKSIGIPALWPLTEFTQREEYRVLIGGKRLRGARRTW